MKSTEPVLLAKCNHIFAWPFEYQWPKDDVENYAEPFKKKGWIEKDMDIQGMRKNGKIQKDIFMLNQYLSSSAKDIFMQTGENICTILEYPFDENDEWKYQIKVGNQYYLLPIQSVELHVYRHGVGILFIQTSIIHPFRILKRLMIMEDEFLCRLYRIRLKKRCCVQMKLVSLALKKNI